MDDENDSLLSNSRQYKKYEIENKISENILLIMLFGLGSCMNLIIIIYLFYISI